MGPETGLGGRPADPWQDLHCDSGAGFQASSARSSPSGDYRHCHAVIRNTRDTCGSGVGLHILWIEGVTIEAVSSASDEFVTTNRVSYPDLVTTRVPSSGAVGAPLPCIGFPESEVHLNHVLSGERTVLLALKHTDAWTDRAWIQRMGGWTHAVGWGRLCYFTPGHSVQDFEKPA
jgi:hypothetical protein